jgi:hypothetical protein
VETTASGSASDYSSGGSFTASVGGNQSPTNESITIEGSGSTSGQSLNYYNTDYENTSFTVDGNSAPSSESIEIEAKSEALSNKWSELDIGQWRPSNTNSNYTAYGRGQWVYLLDAETGVEQWSKKLTDEYWGYDGVTAVCLGSNYLFVAMKGSSENSNDILALDIQDGTEQWSYGRDNSGAEMATNGTYVGIQLGNFSVLILSTDGTVQGFTERNESAGSFDVTFIDNDFFVLEDDSVRKYDSSANYTASWSFGTRPTGLASIGSNIYVKEQGSIWKLPSDLSSSTEINSNLGFAQSDLASNGTYLYSVKGGGPTIVSIDTSGNEQESMSVPYASLNLDADGNNLLVNNVESGDLKMYSTVGTTGVNVDIGSDSYYYTSPSTVTEYPNLSLGSNDLYVNTDSGEVDISIDWTEDHRTQDPSATIDGSTVSHSGALANGETETGSVTVSSPGSYTVDTSTNGGNATFTVDWTEVTHSEDPSLTINGTTFTHNGVLSAGSTTSFTPSESLFGETTDVLDLALTDGEVDVNFDLEIQDQNSVTIDTLPNNWNTNFSDL